MGKSFTVLYKTAKDLSLKKVSCKRYGYIHSDYVAAIWNTCRDKLNHYWEYMGARCNSPCCSDVHKFLAFIDCILHMQPYKQYNKQLKK